MGGKRIKNEHIRGGKGRVKGKVQEEIEDRRKYTDEQKGRT